jgi:hypothetical protein
MNNDSFRRPSKRIVATAVLAERTPRGGDADGA